MVLITRTDALNRQIIHRSKIFKALLLGIASLVVPVLIIVIDPIHTIVNYNLRLGKGSMLYNILVNEFKAAQLSIYIFNITNGDRFLAGQDQKIKVEEVGPFVFQEYHWYENVEVTEDGLEMSMDPKYRADFVAEKSIAHPKDMNLTLPNLPLLSATSIFSNYPYFIQFMFSSMAASLNSKVIINTDVHNYLWGIKDPLITMCNNLAPGLVYFDSVGLLDRLYDNQSDYKIVVKASKEERFKIKYVNKYVHLQKGGIEDVEESQQNFTNTYEGLGYPPDMAPGLPINLYRMGICKTFDMEYNRTKTMEYGGEGLVYTFNNRTFQTMRNPISGKMYHDGLMDISTCYYGLPFVVSVSHYLDADPELLNYVEGMKPDRDLYINEIVIDRRVGVTFNTKMNLQLSMVLDDLSYYGETKQFSNLVVPLVRVEVDQPRMSDGTMLVFYLVYKIAPPAILITEIILCIVGLSLLAYAAKSMYVNCTLNSQGMVFETSRNKKMLTEKLSDVPLITDRRRSITYEF
ncbi:scavenger receptor class B member 1-like [Anticarsia gemmatalis]|uniref:scavenger receptor class B member 1-like n=1 Tax=Anticarsia gemmatalis TaxID=129554 RepID=UPI003F76CCE2